MLEAKIDQFPQSYQPGNLHRREESIFECESPIQNKREIKEELKREMSLI
jgi:hypothetical protein